MSITYVGIIVSVLGFLFQAAGLPFDAGAADGAIKFIVEVIGVIVALWGRFRLGGVKWYGARKPIL